MAELKNIHIGKEIEKQIIHNNLTFAEFARQLNCDRTTVYSIVRNKSIDIDRLIRISEILQYDFIRNIYQQEGNPTGGGGGEKKHIEICLKSKDLVHLEEAGIESVKIVLTKKQQ